MKQPLSRKRIKKLIWVGGGRHQRVDCYVLHTSRYNAHLPQVFFGFYPSAMEWQRYLREDAYKRPHLFPQHILTLGEQAKILAWQLDKTQRCLKATGAKTR